MINKHILIVTLLLLISCNSNDAFDCLQTSGPIIQKNIETEDFNKILVNRDITLFIQDGPLLEVKVVTGSNLIDDIDVRVVDNQLQLTDKNTCNYVRDYGITKIYVTAPNVVEIRSSTQYEIGSIGTLNFNSLSLISEDFNEPDTFTVGDFRLDVNANTIRITTNNISSQYISGYTENLNIGYYSGAGRFEGSNLIAEHINVFHRGSNDMIVNPQQSLTGELRGSGDLISVNTPINVDIEQFYSGKLIYQD